MQLTIPQKPAIWWILQMQSGYKMLHASCRIARGFVESNVKEQPSITVNPTLHKTLKISHQKQ